MIDFYYEEVSDLQLDTNIISKWINEVVSRSNKILEEVTFIFCSDSYILSANKQFLNHDYFTDIITFDYCEANVIKGDILISVDTVRSNSIKFVAPFSEELNRVIIHGILHLLGYKDKTEEQNREMHRLEDEALKLLETIS